MKSPIIDDIDRLIAEADAKDKAELSSRHLYHLGQRHALESLRDIVTARDQFKAADRSRAPDISEAAWDSARTIVAMWDDIEHFAEQEAEENPNADVLDEIEWQVAAVVQGAIDESTRASVPNA